MTSRAPRPRGWTTVWARILAIVALVSLLLPAGYASWMVIDDLSYRGDKFDGLGAGIGAMVLALILVPAAALAVFLRRGGRVLLVIGAVLTGAGWLALLQMGFALL